MNPASENNEVPLPGLEREVYGSTEKVKLPNRPSTFSQTRPQVNSLASYQLLESRQL